MNSMFSIYNCFPYRTRITLLQFIWRRIIAFFVSTHENRELDNVSNRKRLNVFIDSFAWQSKRSLSNALGGMNGKSAVFTY